MVPIRWLEVSVCGGGGQGIKQLWGKKTQNRGISVAHILLTAQNCLRSSQRHQNINSFSISLSLSVSLSLSIYMHICICILDPSKPHAGLSANSRTTSPASSRGCWPWGCLPVRLPSPLRSPWRQREVFGPWSKGSALVLKL